MTAPGFGVDPAELLEFAKGQRTREDALSAAADKAAAVDLGGDTFGQVLSFFAGSAQATRTTSGRTSTRSPGAAGTRSGTLPSHFRRRWGLTRPTSRAPVQMAR